MQNRTASADLQQTSSTFTFARSLFHAAEGTELFEREFVFASAVSAYYSLFHLGVAMILAHCGQPAATGDPHSNLIQKLERVLDKAGSLQLANGLRPDPAEAVSHKAADAFVQIELPELAAALQSVRDMRQFVS